MMIPAAWTDAASTENKAAKRMEREDKEVPDFMEESGEELIVFETARLVAAADAVEPLNSSKLLNIN